jgi:hypothetical protein
MKLKRYRRRCMENEILQDCLKADVACASSSNKASSLGSMTQASHGLWNLSKNLAH